MPEPDVVTIPNVDLVRVGVHEISTGTWRVTPEDLADAVAAHRAGAIRDAVIKLGHTGMGDAAPALGRVSNLQLGESGNVLIGDFHGVPKAVAAVIRRAYPQRSVEGWVNYTDPVSGRGFRFVLTAVALLGAELPGVDGLADLGDVAALYGVAASRVALPSATTPNATEAPRTDTRARAVKVAAARRRRSNRTNGD
ncbi:hypothetical protein MPRF_38940 [Mycolicibacterium parafortuitum]|uniref:Uncharacterized protein n=1 Tax=Mycolicibacterium parafortuitum TaxID=39692 RepID=A0A7I7U7D3_MYCPF|nr:hypothetical protein [Mycolicibacterium parafortuitum]BBY76995.1 hypothetical protein MPRF_38940 [Mycolicibacterium parafortuitum]